MQQGSSSGTGGADNALCPSHSSCSIGKSVSISWRSCVCVWGWSLLFTEHILCDRLWHVCWRYSVSMSNIVSVSKFQISWGWVALAHDIHACVPSFLFSSFPCTPGCLVPSSPLPSRPQWLKDYVLLEPPGLPFHIVPPGKLTNASVRRKSLLPVLHDPPVPDLRVYSRFEVSASLDPGPSF